MRSQHLAAALLIVSAVASARGQSIGEQLERGIYTQETVGDLDRAIEIYRNILSFRPPSRAYAAHAQYRLAQCLLKKGQKADAAQEFRKVINEYADQEGLVERARESVRGLVQYMPGEFHDPITQFSFTSPGWKIGVTSHGPDGSVTVELSGGLFRKAYASAVSRRISAGEISQRLQENLQERIKLGEARNSLFRVRPESVSVRQIGRRAVLSYLAEYGTNFAKKEYGVWMTTGTTEVFIVCYDIWGPFDPLDRNRTVAAVERILESARMQ